MFASYIDANNGVKLAFISLLSHALRQEPEGELRIVFRV